MWAMINTEMLVTQSVSAFSIGFNRWYEISIQLNWIVLLIAIIFIVVFFGRCVKKNKKGRTFTLNGMSLGIGDFSCTFTCSNEVQEIAFKLWIELTTRKIAIPLNDNDIIVEVYNSWYAAFKAIRNLLESIPGKCLNDASELIDITIKVLNIGLRPHLTIWQGKYRKWYEKASKEISGDPQIIQKKYPEYEKLIEDMKRTNDNLINFASQLHRIAFGKDAK